MPMDRRVTIVIEAEGTRDSSGNYDPRPDYLNIPHGQPVGTARKRISSKRVGRLTALAMTGG